MSESKQPDPEAAIWELQAKFYNEECTLLEALSQAFDFGKEASSTLEPAMAAEARAYRALKAEWERPATTEHDWLEFCCDFDWEVST